MNDFIDRDYAWGNCTRCVQKFDDQKEAKNAVVKFLEIDLEFWGALSLVLVFQGKRQQTHTTSKSTIETLEKGLNFF